MDGLKIDLDLTGKELVSISILAHIGAAFLAEDAEELSHLVMGLNNLQGFDGEAFAGMEKLDAATTQAAKLLAAPSRGVWS